jgi:hypothetical protein
MDRFTEETAADLARNARLDRERADESRGEVRADLATEALLVAHMIEGMNRLDSVLVGAGCTAEEATAYRRTFHRGGSR